MLKDYGTFKKNYAQFGPQESSHKTYMNEQRTL